MDNIEFCWQKDLRDLTAAVNRLTTVIETLVGEGTLTGGGGGVDEKVPTISEPC